MAMTLVSTVTVGSGGAASIQFDNIPQTGKDLLILCSMRRTGSLVYTLGLLSFNGETGANNSGIYLEGNGSSVLSSTSGTFIIAAGGSNGANATANTFGNASFYVSNYTQATAKSVSADGVAENNATQGGQGITANRWNNTAAITSCTLTGNDFAQHSTASLYIIS